MYEAFFQLNRRPFSSTPDATCCYFADSVAKTFDELTHCVHAGRGIGVLTGAAGTGKTLLCRKLAADLSGAFKTAFVGTGNFTTQRGLLQGILYELGQPYSGMGEDELRLELISAAKSFLPSYRATLLILDEGHLLNERLLEEIRILSDVAEAGDALVRVILSGQPQLEEQLTSSALEAFNQRIASQVCLESLTRQQTLDYIAYRLNWAGGNSEAIFTPEALDLIARACDGLPRCINQLCDHSLLLAFVSDHVHVGAGVVQEALDDLQQLPLHWNATILRTEPQDSLGTEESSAADSFEAVELDLDNTDCESDLQEGGASFEVGAEMEFGVLSAESSTVESAESESRTSEGPAPESSVEELVFDRYALLDAGRSLEGRKIPLEVKLSKSPAAAFDLVRSVVKTSGRPAFVAENAAEQAALEALSDPRTASSPDRMVDIMLALLKHADGEASASRELKQTNESGDSASKAVDTPETGPRQVELPYTQSEVTPSAFSSIKWDSQSQLVGQNYRVDSAECIEEQIGSDLLDICLETQESLQLRVDTAGGAGPVPLGEEFPRLQSDSDGAPRVTRFDIVEPEQPAVPRGFSYEEVPSPSAETRRQPSGVVPRPNYKMVFSTLRRRQRQS